MPTGPSLPPSQSQPKERVGDRPQLLFPTIPRLLTQLEVLLKPAWKTGGKFLCCVEGNGVFRVLITPPKRKADQGGVGSPKVHTLVGWMGSRSETGSRWNSAPAQGSEDLKAGPHRVPLMGVTRTFLLNQDESSKHKRHSHSSKISASRIKIAG